MGMAVNKSTRVIIARDKDQGEVRLDPGATVICELDTSKNGVTKRLIDAGTIVYNAKGKVAADDEAAAGAKKQSTRAAASRAKDNQKAAAKQGTDAAEKAAEEAAQKAAEEAVKAAADAGDD